MESRPFSLCGFKAIFQKQMCFVSYFLEINIVLLLVASHPTSIDIKALIYPGLVANNGTIGDDNNRDNYHGGITYRQPIGKQISYGFHKRIVSFNGYCYKKDFLDRLLNLEDLFDYENTYCKVVIYNYIYIYIIPCQI